MGQFTETFDAYDVVGAREDLADVIFNVTPSDTPFISSIARTTAKAITHEWQTDTLANVDTTNYQIEGDEFDYTDPAATVRVGNRCQILRKSYIISNTLEAVDKAGRESEIAYQRVKRGLELRRDIEAMTIGSNRSSLVGTAGAARRSGSLSSYLATNETGVTTTTGNRGASGSAGGFSSPDSVLATDATAGDLRAFVQTQLTAVIGEMWDNSGNVNDAVIHAGATQKALLTAFSGVASVVYHEIKDRTVMATADVYASQFGDVKIVPNRYIRKHAGGNDREVYIVRPAFAKLAVLRPIQEIRPAVTGDAEKRVLITECCLEVCNEAAHGVVADLA